MKHEESLNIYNTVYRNFLLYKYVFYKIVSNTVKYSGRLTPIPETKWIKVIYMEA